MKKHLLFGSALLAAISAFPQNGRIPQNAHVENTAANIAKRISMDLAAAQNAEQVVESNVQSPAEEAPSANLKPSNTSSFTTTWNAFTGSFNIYGCALPGSALLNYNEDLNAVTFVHRKSTTYIVSPTPNQAAESGGVIAMVTQNWGANWDSTCVYANNNHLGRYPQGGIYNPPGNICIENSYIVATGPVNTPPPTQNWVGNFYASKPLGPVGAAVNDSIVSSVPNAVQVLLHANTGNEKTEFTRYDFTATDDGKVRAMGIICNDITGTTALLRGFRGSRLMTGTFNSGAFVWTSDSIIPSTKLDATDNTKDAFETPHMAWNESGTVGYIFHIGVAATSTLSNRSYQPIIYKTVNSGASWAPANGIDFNGQGMNAVFEKVLGTRMNPNVVVPLFDEAEGIGAVVDKDDNLHIVALIKGSVSMHPDSIGFTYGFSNPDQQNYGYGHVPGLRPFLFDFYGNGSPASTWSVVVVDSLTSEAPSGLSTSSARGFAEYPWSVTETGNKQISDARIQASRTADGNYIVYTFAESDSALTQNGTKWNEVPNVKARLMDVTTHSIHPTKINITKPLLNSSPFVASRAYFHYASRKCAVAQSTPVGPNGPCIVLPITVSRNTSFNPTTSITHRYASAALNFGGIPDAQMSLPLAATAASCVTLGIRDDNANSANASFIYPNPAKNAAVLSMNLYNNSSVNIVVSNMVGQVVKTVATQGTIGENNVDINISGLVKGIYMVTVKIDGANSTKKLIVE